MAPGGSNFFVGDRSFGTSFHSKHWLSLDPCGMFGVSCSWGVHLYALTVIAAKLLSNSLLAVVIYFGLYVPAAVLAMVSLYKAWTTNPGAVPLGARPLTIVRRASSDSLQGSSHGSVGNGAGAAAANGGTQGLTQQRALRRCHKCNDNYKPPRAHHDSVSGRCIVKFDHFCPWVGNAVGALNHKFFCLFLFYTAITCTLSLVLLLLRTIHCGYTISSSSNKEDFDPNSGTRGDGEEGDERFLRLWSKSSSLHERGLEYKYEDCNHFYSSHFVLGLFICSLVFLVFTCSMGCEQIEAVETGKGKIARMKVRVGQAGTEFQRVTEEFNEMFGGESPKVSWHWFLPNDVEFPRGMKKVVLGYEWDPSFDPEPYEPSETGSLGDREMEDLEAGRAAATAAAVANGGGGARKPPPNVPPAKDVLLTRESTSDDHSVASNASHSSGIKNRKSPPKQID